LSDNLRHIGADDVRLRADGTRDDTGPLHQGGPGRRRQGRPKSPPGGPTPRTTVRYDRARKNLDRHPNYILAAYMASGT
jgi:hypothetical protein